MELRERPAKSVSSDDRPKGRSRPKKSSTGSLPAGVNRSVARALEILMDVARSPKPQSFVDFQRKLKLPKATLHKLLFTLETQRFLHRDEASGRYSMGVATLELSTGGATRSADIRGIISPFLQRLVDENNETANMGVLDGDEEILLERIDPPNQVVRLSIGRRHPAYGSSGGRAALAARGSAIVAAMPERLKPLTENTVKTRRELVAQLKDIRTQGYALDLEETYPGVRCVGVAIDVPGWPVASIAFTLPLQRASVQRLHELAKTLLAARKEIETILALTPRP